VSAWAADVVELAHAGLARLACRDAQGRDETRHLAPLVTLLERGTTRAEELRATARRSSDFVSAVVAATQL
jgi:glutamate--cysteine ligase